ncbi:MAG: histidine-type phosphatase [Pseudomonadota bacterium]
MKLVSKSVMLGILAITPAICQPAYYQTKTPYEPRQDLSIYQTPPPGFIPVFTELVARHGSRGLSGMKADLAVYNMWKQAFDEGALTPLGARLGPDVLKIMKANFLMGYGVPGIGNPGYGNETAVGIKEHTQLASRLLKRLPGYWRRIGKGAEAAPRKIVVVTSGVDRAVDSGAFFIRSLTTRQPNLAGLITYPPAPGPYPADTPVPQPDGTNRFLLYFHKLVPKTDLVTDPADPLYSTYLQSRAYQHYKEKDADLAAKQEAIWSNPGANKAGRAVLSRLFTQDFVNKIDTGVHSFANTGTWSFTSSDGQFTNTLTGDGKTTIKSLADAGSLIYELYAIAPGMKNEAGVDFNRYMPARQAKYFAYLNDASDFYDKGPGMTEKGNVTYGMAEILENDFFGEIDAIAKGNLSLAAKLRFAHAEIIIPFASKLGLKKVLEQLPQAEMYTYENNSWRGQYVSPMAANIQWDVYGNGKGKLLVKMLYNEKEIDFKSDCNGAKISLSSHFYDYQKLKVCYGREP